MRIIGIQSYFCFYVKVNVAAVGPNHLCKTFAAFQTAAFPAGFDHGLLPRTCNVDTIDLRNGEVILWAALTVTTCLYFLMKSGGEMEYFGTLFKFAPKKTRSDR